MEVRLICSFLRLLRVVSDEACNGSTLEDYCLVNFFVFIPLGLVSCQGDSPSSHTNTRAPLLTFALPFDL